MEPVARVSQFDLYEVRPLKSKDNRSHSKMILVYHHPTNQLVGVAHNIQGATDCIQENKSDIGYVWPVFPQPKEEKDEKVKWKATVEVVIELNAKDHAEAQTIMEDADFKFISYFDIQLPYDIIDWEIRPNE